MPTVFHNGHVGFRHRDRDERKFAELLSGLGIAYRYESKMFQLAVDPVTGQTRRGFQPDFYLPGYDVYIELTQGTDKSKRSKVRQTEEMYGVKVLVLSGRVLREVMADSTLLRLYIARRKAS